LNMCLSICHKLTFCRALTCWPIHTLHAADRTRRASRMAGTLECLLTVATSPCNVLAVRCCLPRRMRLPVYCARDARLHVHSVPQQVLVFGPDHRCAACMQRLLQCQDHVHVREEDARQAAHPNKIEAICALRRGRQGKVRVQKTDQRHICKVRLCAPSRGTQGQQVQLRHREA
jgi:hypothetical protein